MAKRQNIDLDGLVQTDVLQQELDVLVGENPPGADFETLAALHKLLATPGYLEPSAAEQFRLAFRKAVGEDVEIDMSFIYQPLRIHSQKRA